MNLRLGLLLVLALAQWAVPGYLIQRGQATLREGTAYKFRTAPVDPADPFRGRYLVLNFEAAWVTVPAGFDVEPRQPLYAPIEVDAEGFARLGVPQKTPPDRGDWLRVVTGWRDDQQRLRVTLPFDRYYLDENAAPAAERLYLAGNRRGASAGARLTYAQVRVREGYAVIEDLVIDGQPLRERLRDGEGAAP